MLSPSRRDSTFWFLVDHYDNSSSEVSQVRQLGQCLLPGESSQRALPISTRMDDNNLPNQLARLSIQKDRSAAGMGSSPLRALPAEIRNLIWEYALHEHTGVPIGTEPSLLRTCKSIRKEAELMFYAVNHFRTRVEEENIQHSGFKWLQNLGDQKRLLMRSLQIHCVIAPATITEGEIDESEVTAEDATFMQLMNLLDDIRGINFGRRIEDVVSFTVSSTDNQDQIFDDTNSFAEISQMSLEKQEFVRAAKFLMLWCVLGKELLDVMLDNEDPDDAVQRLDTRIQENRKEHVKLMSLAGRW